MPRLRQVVSRLRTHRLARNAVALAVVQIAGYVAPVIFIVYLTRVIGLDAYGVVAFSLALVQLGALVVDLGLTLSATERFSRFRDRRDYIERLIGAIWVLKSIVFIVVATLVVAYALLSERYAAHREVLLLSLIPLLGQCFQPLWFFMGLEKLRHFTQVVVASRILSLGLTILWVRTADHLALAVLADGTGQLAAAVVSQCLIVRLGFKAKWPRTRDLLYVLRLTLPFLGSRLAAATYIHSGVVLLGLFSVPSQTAAYSLAERCYQVLQQVFAPIVQAAYPYMARERALPLWLRLTVACVAAAVGLSLISYLFAPWVLEPLLARSAGPALAVLPIFLIGLIVHVVNVFSGFPLAAALRMQHVANRSVWLGASLYAGVAAALVALDLMTARSLAWTMVLAELCIASVRAATLWPRAMGSLRSI